MVPAASGAAAVRMFLAHCLGRKSRTAPLGPAGAAAAALAFVWNPYVAERLSMGQWAVLVGYAALPWVVHAAWQLGRGAGTRGWRRLAVAAALGALGGAPGWLLTVVGAL